MFGTGSGTTSKAETFSLKLPAILLAVLNKERTYWTSQGFFFCLRP
jgi:hypothetical protein